VVRRPARPHRKPAGGPEPGRRGGEVDGPPAGLRALDGLDAALGEHHRLDAVRAHLLERAGRHDEARASYLRAARRTTSTAERDHLTKKAAQLRSRPEVR
jgi:predicted RNA polymerase sigma factor